MTEPKKYWHRPPPRKIGNPFELSSSVPADFPWHQNAKTDGPQNSDPAFGDGGVRRSFIQVSNVVFAALALKGPSHLTCFQEPFKAD